MLIHLSQFSSQSIQDQIVSQIRARILSGELAANEPLTSIRTLANTLRIGVTTVQRAYDRLTQEELIYARPGKGYFVVPLAATAKQTVASQRFAESLRGLMADAVREGLSGEQIAEIFQAIRKETQ